jgi:hypothetical protein
MYLVRKERIADLQKMNLGINGLIYRHLPARIFGIGHCRQQRTPSLANSGELREQVPQRTYESPNQSPKESYICPIGKGVVTIF